MTAEVAILNKYAVALAADSALTAKLINPLDKTKPINKIFPGNKIFMLSKCHPVGIMYYNVADFMSVPWEVIIKMYREELGDKSKATIQEYADDFIKYLQKESICTGSQQRSNNLNIFYSYLNLIKNDINRYRKDGDDQHVALTLMEDIKNWEKNEIIPSMSTVTGDEIINRNIEEFEYARKEVFESLELSDELNNLVNQYMGVLVNRDILSDSKSGIVFAGFGENEIFPTVIEYETDGVLGGQVKIIKRNHYDISREEYSSAIIPFAQQDMFERFLWGVDFSYESYIKTRLTELMKKYGSSIIEIISNKVSFDSEGVKNAVGETLNENLEEFFSECYNFRKTNFADPILDTLYAVPKDELGNMAEAIVNLSSINRRYSAVTESVGGPVDVAVISKGDGFVWMKRKHYFSPDLNLHYANRYQTFRNTSNKDRGTDEK